MRKYRRFYSTLSITYDTPPSLIEVFIEGLNKIVASHPHTRKDNYNIFLNNFGDSSLNIMFYIFFEAPTWALELKYRHEIMIRTLQLAEKLNVRFAFPTRTLHMENFPEKATLTPRYMLSQDEMKRQLDSFFKEEKE
jgi:MscS family membrane protein